MINIAIEIIVSLSLLDDCHDPRGCFTWRHVTKTMGELGNAGMNRGEEIKKERPVFFHERRYKIDGRDEPNHRVKILRKEEENPTGSE